MGKVTLCHVWNIIDFVASLFLLQVGHLERIMFWSFVIGNILYYVIGITLAFLFKDNRAFCKYLCPITVFLKPASYFSLVRVNVMWKNVFPVESAKEYVRWMWILQTIPENEKTAQNVFFVWNVSKPVHGRHYKENLFPYSNLKYPVL